MLSRVLAPVLLLSVGLVGPTQASRSVTFEDGRTLEVESIAEEAGQVQLELPGGGLIVLPATRVIDWGVPALEIATGPQSSAPEPGPPWRDAAGVYAELIAAAAARHGLDPVLLTAVAEVESNFDPHAVSHKGARGFLQLMPATARRFGVADTFDTAQNLEGGARYLRWLLERFEGQTDLALAGYNAGEGAVERHGGIPPYQETREYVARVLSGADRLSRLAP